MWIGFILSQKIWKFVTSLSLRLIWKKELMSIPNKLRETFHRWLIFFAFPRPCSRLFWCSFCFRFRFRLWSRFHLGLSRFWQSFSWLCSLPHDAQHSEKLWSTTYKVGASMILQIRSLSTFSPQENASQSSTAKQQHVTRHRHVRCTYMLHLSVALRVQRR